jgi:type IV pilus assembly protein PilM
MENTAQEIQRAMQFFFTSTQYSSVDHILLTGGTSALPGFDDVVSSRTRINAMVANPFANMQISPRIQLKKLIADAPALMIACGLAMRRFDA